MQILMQWLKLHDEILEVFPGIVNNPHLFKQRPTHSQSHRCTRKTTFHCRFFNVSEDKFGL